MPARADPRFTGRALQDAIKDVIGALRCYLGDWYVGEAGWCVELLYHKLGAFHGLTLEMALAWCLVYLMTDELRIDGFAS